MLRILGPVQRAKTKVQRARGFGRDASKEVGREGGREGGGEAGGRADRQAGRQEGREGGRVDCHAIYGAERLEWA